MTRPPGFTLIELLVVIAIIVILVALLMPSIKPIMEELHRLQCASRLRALGQVYLTYVELHNQSRFPPIWALSESSGVGSYASWYYPQNNYQLFVAGRLDSGFGPLIFGRSPLVKDASIFVCPTIQAMDSPWWHTGADAGGEHFHSGWENPDPIPAVERWYTSSPYKGYTRSTYSIRSYLYPLTFDQAQGRGVRAFLADNLSHPTMVLGRHGDGVNVACLDGTVRYHNDELLWNNQMTTGYIVKEPIMDQIWALMDK